LFFNNRNLKKIDLKYNKILAIGPQAFDGLYNLAEVIIYDNICVDEKYGKIVMEDQKLFVMYSERGCFKDTIEKTELTNLKCIVYYDFMKELLHSASRSTEENFTESIFDQVNTALLLSGSLLVLIIAVGSIFIIIKGREYQEKIKKLEKKIPRPIENEYDYPDSPEVIMAMNNALNSPDLTQQ
jgi:hypothetical protein